MMETLWEHLDRLHNELGIERFYEEPKTKEELERISEEKFAKLKKELKINLRGL